MDRTFYRSLVTNKIFDSNDVKFLSQIDNGISFRNLLDTKKVIAIDTPTIEDAVNHYINPTTAVSI